MCLYEAQISGERFSGPLVLWFINKHFKQCHKIILFLDKQNQRGRLNAHPHRLVSTLVLSLTKQTIFRSNTQATGGFLLSIRASL